MVAPTFGVALSTVLVTPMSTCRLVTVALELLFPATGSYWSEWETAAVFV